MIAAWMAYALVIALLVSAAALAAERIAILRRLPSRWVWVSALLPSILLPVLFAWQGNSSVEPAKALAALATNEAPPVYTRSPIAWIGADTGVVTRRVPIDTWLLAGWTAMSALALAILGMGWIQLNRRLRSAAVLLPWNLPIGWQLRRLRFAMEVDCDARVLRAGQSLSSYSTALLNVATTWCRCVRLLRGCRNQGRRSRNGFASCTRRAAGAGGCWLRL